MKSKMLICLIYSETVLAVALAAGIAQSYGRILPAPCLKSRSARTIQGMCENGGPGNWSGCKSNCWAVHAPETTLPMPCAKPSLPPMLPTGVAKPTSANSIVREGWATWYSRQSCRREGTGGKRILMANGQPLNDQALTCALWITNKLGGPLKPDGRLVKISRAGSSRTLTVAWTDNGPGRVPRSRGVVCDLTPAAMLALAGPAGIKAGRVAVRLEEI